MRPRLKSHQSPLTVREIGAQYSACVQIHIRELHENEFFKQTVNVVLKSIV